MSITNLTAAKSIRNRTLHSQGAPIARRVENQAISNRFDVLMPGKALRNSAIDDVQSEPCSKRSPYDRFDLLPTSTTISKVETGIFLGPKNDNGETSPTNGILPTDPAIVDELPQAQSTSQRLQGDVNNDGMVDLNDINAFRNSFGEKGDDLAADLDKDGIVGDSDLTIIRDNFGLTAAV